MENDDYLQYLYDKKINIFSQYKEIEEDKQNYDIKSKNYKNYKNKINKLSNKLANINNSIYFYEQFMINKLRISKKKEEEIKDNLIQQFMKILLILSFSNFNSKINDTYKEEENNISELLYNLEFFPKDIKKFIRVNKFGVFCLKMWFQDNETSEKFLNFKYEEIKNSLKNKKINN